MSCNTPGSVPKLARTLNCNGAVILRKVLAMPEALKFGVDEVWRIDKVLNFRQIQAKLGVTILNPDSKLGEQLLIRTACFQYPTQLANHELSARHRRSTLH